MGRSIAAIFAGLVTVTLLSLGIDEVLHLTGIYPPWGERMSDPLFVLATAYRSVIGVLGGYIAARLAPGKPMKHAVVLGVIGTVLAIGGAIATWNLPIGPHWYPLALAVTALPLSWFGGWLRARR